MSVRHLTIVGLGLIGGSIAAAAKRADATVAIRAVGPGASSRAWALEHGIVDEAADEASAVEAGWFADGVTDLLVIGAPIPATVEWLHRLGGLGFSGIVTDVASTKRAVVEAAAAHAGEYRFVGGHPMAGSERSGVEASSPSLFDGAYYILTPTESTEIDAYRRVHAFATSLGARVISIDASEHDDAVAIVSHVPHVAAAALVDLARSRAESAGADLLRLAAGGFKDTTRVAAGSPELWTGICLDNADAVAQGLADLESGLASFRRSVAERDADAVQAWLESAAAVRRSIPAQWVPSTARLSQLSVPITDRPGMVGIVTTALSRYGCNIEDIEIDHQSEASAILRLILTDEGDIDAAMAELRGEGFSPSLVPLVGGEG